MPKRVLCTRLLAYAWPHRASIAAHLGLSIIIALLELLTPWPMKIVVDSILADHPLPRALEALLPASVGLSKVPLLVAMVAAGLGLKALTGALTLAEAFLNIRVRQRIVLALKSRLFQHLQRLSLTFHDSRRLGDSIYRVSNDAYCVEDFVASALHLLTASCTLAAMLWIVFSIDWSLALLSAAVAPLLYWSVDFYFKRFSPRIHRVQQMEAESTSIVQETLSNLRVVKAFAREDYEHDRFLAQGDSTANARITLTFQQSLFSVTVGMITAAGTALVLGLGAWHVMRGSLTVGELLVVLAYLASIYGPLEAISGTLTAIQTDLVKAERVFELLDTGADVEDLPDAVPLAAAAGRVTFQNVGFGYRHGVEILRGIDFDVEPGQTIGIVGPTGAGKTSLVSLVPRFYDVTAGRVMIDGIDVRALQLKSLRQQVALVLQDSILFSGTIAENIGYGKTGATLDEIVEAARAANAHQFITALPDGYQTQVGERGVKLSGGERQRISIARAFLNGARILILDEPTSAVDTRTEAVILEALERLMRGRTTFIIAHRLSTLRRADHILVLDHGRIVERGSQADLLRHGNVYATLARSQA